MGNSNGKRNRQYTDEQKRMLVLMCEAAGYPNTEGAIGRVSKEQGIPYKTLEGWVKRGIKYGGDAQAAADELMEETRQDLREMIDIEVNAIFKGMKIKREEATYKDLTVAAGILIDKLQLLNDKPTENVKQAITFVREGISTIPEHLTPGAVDGTESEAEV